MRFSFRHDVSLASSSLSSFLRRLRTQTRPFFLAKLAALVMASVTLCALPSPTLAQDPARFEDEIAAFEKSDRLSPPKSGPILFVGSSSIRLWTNLVADFPNHYVLNRGFGGSHLSDVNRLFDRIVKPYKPRAIVLYAGDNDLAAGKSPEIVLDDFQTFVGLVRAHLGDTPIAFISIKYSPSRLALLHTQKRANRLVQNFTQTDPRLSFIPVADPLLGRQAAPDPAYFVSDLLHLNLQGYKIWREIIGKHLATLVPPQP